MLEILQYSMNAVFPILLLIVLGYYAKRAGMLSEQTIAQINRFNFRYGYFCLMFVNIYGVDLKEGLPVTMIALVLGIIALLTVVGWVAASFLTKERSRKGVLIQASFRSNYAIIGMMMAQALAGDEGAALVAIFQLPAVLYYNSVSVLAMSIYSDSGNKPTVGSVMKSMAQNPLIRGILTALVVIVVRLFLPVGADGQPVFTNPDRTGRYCGPFIPACRGGRTAGLYDRPGPSVAPVYDDPPFPHGIAAGTNLPRSEPEDQRGEPLYEGTGRRNHPASGLGAGHRLYDHISSRQGWDHHCHTSDRRDAHLRAGVAACHCRGHHGQRNGC